MELLKLVLVGIIMLAGHQAVMAQSLPAPVPCDTSKGSCWKPAMQTRWNYVLSTAPSMGFVAGMYDIDLFDNSAATVNKIHAVNRKTICYFSAGSSENWRADFNKLPSFVLGAPLDGWAGERWLDIRKIDALAPVMTARLDLCKQKGFDGVEFDNVDGYANKSGFPLTANDQLKYNIFLANEAHKRGLTVALKNDLEQVSVLSNYFDYAVNEECFAYGECNMLLPFTRKNKAVFNVEYKGRNEVIFKKANALNFNTIKKSLNLNNRVIFSR